VKEKTIISVVAPVRSFSALRPTGGLPRAMVALDDDAWMLRISAPALGDDESLLGSLNIAHSIKIKDANSIKQYRSICLLNVDFKIFTKVLSNRLSQVAKVVVGGNQTSFIKYRNILEGVVILHEVIHDLK
jgi:23S rRNA U2552 (ribose-2'-O)-methylase RlmE/FtsJ